MGNGKRNMLPKGLNIKAQSDAAVITPEDSTAISHILMLGVSGFVAKRKKAGAEIIRSHRGVSCALMHGSLLAVLLLAGSLCQQTAHAQTTNTFVTFFGPDTITCGSSATFKYTVFGRDTGTPTISASLFRQGFLSDDNLGAIGSDIASPGPNGAFSVTHTFLIKCLPEPDCTLVFDTGPGGIKKLGSDHATFYVKAFSSDNPFDPGTKSG